MSKPRLGRPSPALIVAVVALVAALGGTAVAATQINGNSLRPKSVGGGKLKQFTAGLLKKQSLGGGKVKPDTLGGFQIKEDTLATVPSAKALAGDSRYYAKLAFGQAQTLATVGSLTLTAQCIQNATNQKAEAGQDLARIVISTSEAGSVFRGSTDSKPGGPSGALDPTTPQDERVAIEYSVPTGTGEYLSGGSVSAYAPNGSALNSPADGDAAAIGLFGAGCVFHGAVFQG